VFLQDNEESLAYLVYSYNGGLNELYQLAVSVLQEFYSHNVHAPPGFTDLSFTSCLPAPVWTT